MPFDRIVVECLNSGSNKIHKIWEQQDFYERHSKLMLSDFILFSLSIVPPKLLINRTIVTHTTKTVYQLVWLKLYINPTIKTVGDGIPILIHCTDDDDSGPRLRIAHQSGHLVVVKLRSLVVDIICGNDNSRLCCTRGCSIIWGDHFEFIIMRKLPVIIQSPVIYTVTS